jgi:hypothetical protein
MRDDDEALMKGMQVVCELANDEGAMLILIAKDL